MSTEIYNSSTESVVKCGLLAVVADCQPSLSDYVRRVIRDKGLNYREVARRSGDAISHATVGHVINNTYKDITLETLKALARGLGESEEEVIRHARGGRPPSEKEFRESRLYLLFTKLAEASPDDKKYVETSIDDLIHRLERHAPMPPPKEPDEMPLRRTG